QQVGAERIEQSFQRLGGTKLRRAQPIAAARRNSGQRNYFVHPLARFSAGSALMNIEMITSRDGVNKKMPFRASAFRIQRALAAEETGVGRLDSPPGAAAPVRLRQSF